MYQVNYVRITRQSTDSWITVKLPKEMSFDQACVWAEKRFKGWMAATGCFTNPDEVTKEDEG